MSILEKQYEVLMSDGSVWAVPVRVIAENRAAYYAGKDGISIEESLKDDTVPLFEDDAFEIKDWAQNNMNWSDVESHAVMIEEPSTDYQDGWMNGDVEIK